MHACMHASSHTHTHTHTHTHACTHTYINIYSLARQTDTRACSGWSMVSFCPGSGSASGASCRASSIICSTCFVSVRCGWLVWVGALRGMASRGGSVPIHSMLRLFWGWGGRRSGRGIVHAHLSIKSLPAPPAPASRALLPVFSCHDNNIVRSGQQIQCHGRIAHAWMDGCHAPHQRINL